MTSSLRGRDIDLAPEGLQTHNLKEGLLKKKSKSTRCDVALCQLCCTYGWYPWRRRDLLLVVDGCVKAYLSEMFHDLFVWNAE